MIRLIIKGGLGNQMFQYAAIKALATKLATPFVIDLSFIQNRLPVAGFTPRKYELNLFNLNLPTTTLLKNKLLDTHISYPVEKGLMIVGVWSSYVESDVYKLDPKFFNQPANVVVEGFFNNYKYFEMIENEIRRDFDTEKLYDPKFTEIERKIKESNSVSINIRRGDYLNKKHSDVFVYLDVEYYTRALTEIRNRVENPHFFIFSYDDPTWLQSNLNLDAGEFTVMGKEFAGHKFKTYLRLISLCKHNIISNSTFAFWGAYLNKNSKKVVVTPNRWALTWSNFESPPDWLVLEV